MQQIDAKLECKTGAENLLLRVLSIISEDLKGKKPGESGIHPRWVGMAIAMVESQPRQRGSFQRLRSPATFEMHRMPNVGVSQPQTGELVGESFTGGSADTMSTLKECDMLGHRFGHAFMTLIALTALGLSNAAAQQAATSNSSVEALTSLLQTIDPYRPKSEASGKVAVFGSTSMDAMAHGWTQGFRQFHPEVKVEISAAGTEEAFSKLVEQPTSVVMLSRPVTEEEITALKKQGLREPVAIVVAREALSVFVHASNPQQAISGEQLRAVFTTSSGNSNLTWGDLGAAEPWKSKPIHVISRSDQSGTQRYLRDFVFNNASLREGQSTHVSNAEVLQAVGADPLAIAICGYRSSGDSVRALKLVAGASVVPSDDHAVLSGQYPLTRALSLVIDIGQSEPSATAAREFVRYALGQAGQTQAILVGFFPVDSPLLRAELDRLDASKLP